jgi:cell division protein FtsB
MPAPADTPRPRSSRSIDPEPLRRRQAGLPSRSPSAGARALGRRAVSYLLVFATVVLLVDALVGERGLIASTRARRQYEELNQQVERTRRENAQLRETARRLKEDPTTIESEARDHLGLIRPGEVLVIIKDVKPSK